MHTLKKFIHYYQPYKLVFFIDLICAAIISLVDLSYPQILRTMTKTLFTRDTAVILHALPWIASGLLLMYLIQSLCKYYVSYQGHMMGANMERDMRQQLFDHYEELSFSYYSQNNSGQMMSKLVSDLFDISEFACCKDHWCIYFSFYDQPQTGFSISDPGRCDVPLFFQAEPQDAGNFHGKPPQDWRYQRQSAGHSFRYPGRTVLRK